MRRYVIVFFLAFLSIFLSGEVFWYFENVLYCSFDQQNVKIFLKDEWWLSKCEVYLNTIYNLAQKKYWEIMLIRSYIAQGDDVYYWKQILETKNEEFLQLMNYRLQIKNVIEKFESSFFDRYYKILQDPMRAYYSDLETQYYILLNQSNKSQYATRISQLEQQMWNVSHVLNAKNLDEIMEVVPTYIYLKQRLSWR